MRGGSQALVTIDGTHGEGGGALVRTSLVMAALTQQGVRIQDVRGGTRHPGLDAEDLTLLKALCSISRAETVGDYLGSNSISFLPTTRPSGFKGEIPSIRNDSNRGANALVVLGSLIPVLARSGVYSTLEVEGETFGSNAISYDYFDRVTLPALQKVGLYAYPELTAVGFGRESKGRVALDVEPSTLNGIDWSDRGGLKSVQAVVTTSGIPLTVGERIVSHLRTLAQSTGLKIQVQLNQIDEKTAGAFVTTWATYERGMGGGTAMGARGIRGETLAQQAFQEMFEWMTSSTTTDPFLADQLLLPLAIAESPSVFSVSRLTMRFLTIVWVIKQFTPIHITVRGTENGPGVITIERR